MIKVYAQGNNVIVEKDGLLHSIIPKRSFRFDIELNNCFIRDIEVNKTIQSIVTNIQNQSGVAFTQASDVITYLSEFVGFSTASGGSEAGDVESGELVGNNLVLTLKGGGTIVIDATPMLADLRVTSGTYNSTTKNLDFTLSDSSIISVPVSALLPVTTDATLSGNGATVPLKVELSGNNNNLLTLGTDGKLYVKNKKTIVSLNSDISTTSNISSDTGINVNLVAGKKYKLTLIGAYQSNTITNGIKLGFIAPTGTFNVIGSLKCIITTGTSNTEVHASITAINSSSNTVGSFLLSTSVAVINTAYSISGEIFIICTASGEIRLQFASEVNGNTTTLLSNSTLILEEIL